MRKCPTISPDEGGGGGNKPIIKRGLKMVFLAATINPSEIGIKWKLKV